MYGVERLIENRVLSVRQTAGKEAEYTWNTYFLQTGDLSIKDTSANLAQVDVQSLHTPCEKSAQVHVQTLHHIYIEFLLDYLSKLFLEYFKNPNPLIKRVPPKRGQKGVAKDFATNYYITRKDSWTEAINEAVKKGGYVRTYLACVGGFNIDQVNYPKAYLKKLIWDEGHQWESQKKSNLAKQGHLDSDAALLRFIKQRSERGYEAAEEDPKYFSEETQEMELTYMTGEESGEEIYE